MSEGKKRNIIIGSLCAVVLLMAVGYAAFQSVLKINGTSSISSNWDIKITSIDTKNIVGEATNAKEPTGVGTLTATFDTNLVSPGDSLEYEITVTNSGSLNAVLEKITLTDTNNPAIKFTTSGLTEGSILAANGGTAVLTVKVEYVDIPEGQGQPDNTKSDLKVTLDYAQEGGNGSDTPIQNPSKVEIINIEPTNIVGEASIAETPTYEKLTANLKTNLINNDDSLDYDITIQNQGDNAAVLTDLVINEHNENATITYSGVKEGDILQGNESALLKVKVSKSENAPDGNIESDVDVKIDYELEEEVTNKTYTVTYDYKTNGGVSSNAEDTALEFGQKVNLDYTAEKEGYIFIGWNTDKTATTGLTELSITGKNIVLYAIFKEQTKLETPIIEITKTGTDGTKAVITYPSGCENGIRCSYSINGVEHQVTTSTIEVNISQDTILIVKTSYSDEELTTEKIIDLTAPEVSVNAASTTNSITAVVSATDTLSEITKYEFSIDSGEYIDNGTNKVYTFDNLEQNINHTIKVRVTNSSGLIGNATKEITTKNLEVPTYEEIENDNGKTVKITYPEGCGDTLICSYIKDDETEVNVSTKNIEVDFTESGILVGKINDGRNTVSSSYTIKIKTGPNASDQLITKVVETGVGLYADKYEKGRYIYKGNNPDNYIIFNDEKWRILSIESNEMLKIVRAQDLEWSSSSFDTAGLRKTGYCSGGLAPNQGCNAWSKSVTFSYDSFSGAVEKDAELNIYLNTTYYNTLTDLAKSQIQEGIFNIGGVNLNNNDLSNAIEEEKKYTSMNKIALVTATEYSRASTKCTSIYAFKRDSECYNSIQTHDWLYNLMRQGGRDNMWLLSPGTNNNTIIYADSGGLSTDRANSFRGIAPTLYLKSNITLSGSGTQLDPYTINS